MNHLDKKKLIQDPQLLTLKNKRSAIKSSPLNLIFFNICVEFQINQMLCNMLLVFLKANYFKILTFGVVYPWDLWDKSTVIGNSTTEI